MTATREQSFSASGKLWVVRNTVTPSRRASAARSSRSAAAATGSKPAVGSSRKINGGRCNRARATASFCFMPRLQTPAASRRRSPESKGLQQLLDSRPPIQPWNFPDAAEQLQVVLCRQPLVETGILQQAAAPQPDLVGLTGRIEAQHRHFAKRGLQKPEQHPDRGGLT